MQDAPKSESVKNRGRFAASQIARWPKRPFSPGGPDLAWCMDRAVVLKHRVT